MEKIAHKIEEKERTEDIKLSQKIPFRKMDLDERVRQGIVKAGFEYPTVLQAHAIPLGKAGIDLLIQAKSGTGKTVIFCAVICEAHDPRVKAPQALVLVPTREIAKQIHYVLEQIGKCLPGFAVVSVIGGTDIAEDRKRVHCASVVVGTPGRILHLFNNLILNPEHIRLLVIDEADKFAEGPFRQKLEEINESLIYKRHTIACSATLSMELDKKLAKYMKSPLLISMGKRETVLVGIKQFFHEIPEAKTNIMEMTAKVTALKKIFTSISFKQCIAFVNSQSRAESYCNYLEKDGWPCDFMSGAQDQRTRLEIFQRLRDFKTRILISTDLMSRGIDSENLNLVINLELPDDGVTYLHRIGRAGRFGSHGIALSFINSERDKKKFAVLLKAIGPDMRVLKYPENTSNDLWNFSNLKEEEQQFGVFQAQDSDTDKENSPVDGEANGAQLKEEDESEVKVDKKPLTESSNNPKLTYTISNSHKAPSNSAVTLDDASSLTADSDILHCRQGGKSSNSKGADSKTKAPPKVSALELVLDSSSQASIVKADLFEDYKQSVVPPADFSNAPQTLVVEPDCSSLVSVTKESLQSFSELIPKVPQTAQNLKSLVLDNSFEATDGIDLFADYDKIGKNNPTDLQTKSSLKTQTESSSSCMPGPSSSSAMDQSTSRLPSSAPCFRKARTSRTDDSTDSAFECPVEKRKASRRKVDRPARPVEQSGESEYNGNSESDPGVSESTPSSGFEDKVPTEASSGIETSTADLDSDSKSDDYGSYYSSSSSDESSSFSDDNSSESYEPDEYDSPEEEDPLQQTRASPFHPMVGNPGYHEAYYRWMKNYWEQVSQINEYLRISKYASGLSQSSSLI